MNERKQVTASTPPGLNWIVEPAEAGLRLDAFLAAAARLGSRGRARWALERGKVQLNDVDASPGTAAVRLNRGDRVRAWLDRPGTAKTRMRAPVRSDGRLAIVYEDEALIVVNKPAGLLTVPLARRAEATSVSAQLAEYSRAQGKRRPLVVHRIDRDTSGLVLFARHPAAQQALKAQFEQREPQRVYLAVVHGVPQPMAGHWHDWLAWDGEELVQLVARPGDPHARESRSEYRVLEAFPAVPAALLEVRLVTGKRNQIRVQAQLHGHPLVGEQMYSAGGGAAARDVPAFPRQALHAWQLVCRHPSTGRPLALEAPMPADLQALVARFRQGAAAPTGGSPKKGPGRGPTCDVRRLRDSKE